MNMFIGFGYDIHILVKGKPLILGGVRVPFDKGLAGHSDADVVLHAVCDAVLGAIGEGDIGEHFPDTDAKYKDISSTILLGKVEDMVLTKGMKVNNIDITIVCESPMLSAYKKEMRLNISRLVSLEAGHVNIKAKTNEGMGEIGRGEAISVYAVVSLEKVASSKIQEVRI